MKSFPIRCFLLTVILLLFITKTSSSKTNIDSISLQNKQVPFVPTKFYISQVSDIRETKTIGWLLNVKTGIKAVRQRVFLKGGEFTPLRHFIINSTPRNTNLRPIEIAIRKCSIIESESTIGRVDGKVDVTFVFYLQKNHGDAIELVEYNGAVKYNRAVADLNLIEPVLSQALIGGLTYFNSWINREAASNPKLARGIKIRFEDYQNQEEDTLYYSVNKPLSWDDFKDVPRNNHYGAEVFAGFGFDCQSKIHDGIIYLNIIIKVFLPRSASWVRAGNRTPYVLNHEQRHFDIAKITAERFKRKVLSANLSVNNYEGYFSPQYFEALREMNSLQSQYDNETGHGSDRLAQEIWNINVDRELNSYGVIKEPD